jgi:hypothetical protein
MALVTTGHPASLTTCIDLLADREADARAGALRALGASGRADVALAVRLFALRGEAEPGVLAEAFAALMGLAPGEDSVAFVAERLADANDDTARAAAAALGESRRPAATSALRARLSGETRADVRHALILALATSRQDEAFDLLVDLVARGSPADSRSALDAARLYPHDEMLQHRFQDARRARPTQPTRRR